MQIDNALLQRIVEIAKLYYKEGKTQEQIAKKLEISRPLVSSLLTRARDLDIVQIEIKSPFSTNEELLLQLKERYRLNGGIIIPNIKDDYIKNKMIVERGGELLLTALSESRHIGIGWGVALDEIISSMSEFNLPAAKRFICPLMGNLNSSSRAYHPNELARRLSLKCDATPLYLNAPVFPLNLQEQTLYSNTENFRAIQNEWENLDLIVMALSSYPSVPDLASAYRLSGTSHMGKIVGEMLSYYYCDDGKVVMGENDYSIRLHLEQLRKVKTVIAVCQPNIQPITVKGALMSGFINYIILDEGVAEEICED